MPVTSPVYAGNRITATLLAAAIGVTAWKTSSTSVTSSTALIADPDLVVPVAANATYQVSMVLMKCSGGGSGGLAYTFTVPAGTGGDYIVVRNGTGGTISIIDTGSWTATDATNCNAGLTLNGYLTTGGTAGSLQLEWAQNTSNATATVVGAGSFLWARRIA